MFVYYLRRPTVVREGSERFANRKDALIFLPESEISGAWQTRGHEPSDGERSAGA
jgi:hypothetical protein